MYIINHRLSTLKKDKLMKLKVSGGYSEVTLTDGWHPAVLVGISEHEKPENFLMSTPTLLRWHLVAWEDRDEIDEQSSAQKLDGTTSTAFSPRSKAFRWVKDMLGRKLEIGEDVDFDALLPYPCRIKTEENEKGFRNVIEFDKPEKWQAALKEHVAVKEAVSMLQGDDITDPKVPDGVIEV
jgi:hypothetical protein